MEEDKLRISGIVRESIVDGPGIRYVIFTQGCPHHCEGCHNPTTHDYCGGKVASISKIVEDIKKDPLLKGVTISGGEPFLQAKKVTKLINKLDRKKLDIMVYTGFEYEKLIDKADDNNGFKDLLNSADILIDGKFENTLKSDNIPFRGSSNQRAINCKLSLNEGTPIPYEF